MKNVFLIVCVLSFGIGCNQDRLSHKEIVTRYYRALEAGNFQEVKKVINDSVTMISGDYSTPYTQENFYEFFTWDSVFKSSYKVIELEEKNSQVFATVAQDNIRNEFLKNNPLIFKVKISLVSGEISKFEELEYMDTNWSEWNEQKDSLVNWIAKYHPELDGFVHQMTREGAINYVKAIKLYPTKSSGFDPNSAK